MMIVDEPKCDGVQSLGASIFIRVLIEVQRNHGAGMVDTSLAGTFVRVKYCIWRGGWHPSPEECFT